MFKKGVNPMNYNNGPIWDEWISDEALGISFNGEGLKRESSHIHLSLFFYLLITYVIVFAVSILGYFILPEEAYVNLFGNPVFNVLLSIGAQYVIAFPLFILIMRRGSTPTPVRGEKIPFSELALLTLIAEALMLAGSMVGNYAAQFFGMIFGGAPSNSLDNLLEGTPIWLTVLSVVICAPIVEEIIFRKMFIDRLAPHGGALAVVISSIAFMLIHSNIYQFPYAFMVGLLLGYVYLRSGEIKYTIAIHMIMNFLGSVAILPLEDATLKMVEMLEIMAQGQEVAIESYASEILIVAIYSIIQFVIMIAGIVALFRYIRRNEVNFRELIPHGGEAFRASYVNRGAIIFAVVTLLATVATFLT